jgi:hypothetical protein
MSGHGAHWWRLLRPSVLEVSWRRGVTTGKIAQGEKDIIMAYPNTVYSVECLWNIAPYGSSKNRRFGGTNRPHLQVNETFESSPLAVKICLTTNGEEGLLQRNFHSPYLSVGGQSIRCHERH